MSDIAIQVEDLGKLYHIGARPGDYPTLREALVNGVKHLTTRMKNASNANAFWALKDVACDIRQGEVVGIIGRNGAGKSTLLKVLSHITEPTTGRVTLYGRVGSLLEVGTGFHPELTGRENIFLNGAILGMARAEIERKFDEIVDFAEIERFLDTPVKRYSSGMYVRLAFAVAAHLEPEILLVDEVLAVGDAEFQKKCMGKMGSVAKEGRTVLFVSHNLQAVESLCQKGICLTQGQVSFEGRAFDAVAHYLKSQNFDQVHERGLETLPRRTDEGTALRLTRIGVRFPDGDQSVWQPLHFDLDVRCLAPSCDTSPSVEVWRYDGTCAFTCDAEDGGLVLHLKQGMTGRVSVDIAHPNLPPGKYYARAVARSGGRRVLDWVDQALVFDVYPIEDVSIRMQEKHLGLRPRSQWNFEMDHSANYGGIR